MSEEVITGLVVGVALILPTIVATVIFENPITQLLARIGGGRRRLRGHWVSRWNRLDEDTDVWHFEHVLLQQFQSKVFAKLLTGGRRFSARVEGNHLTGEWWDGTTHGGRYGAVQLMVKDDGRTMEGKWVGFSENRAYTRYGCWEMRRVFDPEFRHGSAEAAWERACQ